MNDIWNRIGNELVEYAYEEAPFSKRRGLVAELFPFIYEASKRMSTRAIGQWLKREKKIELSAATLAKALREQDKHIDNWMDELEPYARRFAEAHQIELRPLLFLTNDEFRELCQEPALTAGKLEEDQVNEMTSYESALNALQEDWFSIPEATRSTFAYRFLKRQSEDKEKAA